MLAALLMADELHDLRSRAASLRKTLTAQQKVASTFRASREGARDSARDGARDGAREARMAQLVQRAEAIAAGLEHA